MPRFGCFGRPVLCRAPDDGLAHASAIQDDELVRLDAVVTDNYISGSDPVLQVRAPDGVNWTIQLSSHTRNLQAGLTQSQALPGDAITVVGQAMHAFGENRIQAQHLTIGGRDFDLSKPEPQAG